MEKAKREYNTIHALPFLVSHSLKRLLGLIAHRVVVGTFLWCQRMNVFVSFVYIYRYGTQNAKLYRVHIENYTTTHSS